MEGGSPGGLSQGVRAASMKAPSCFSWSCFGGGASTKAAAPLDEELLAPGARIASQDPYPEQQTPDWNDIQVRPQNHFASSG